MCDCYGHKCDNEKCDKYIPIHITDFCTSRKNVLAYCPSHIPEDFNGKIYKLTKREGDLPRDYKIGIMVKDVNQLPPSYSIDDPAPEGKNTAVTPNLCCVEVIN